MSQPSRDHLPTLIAIAILVFAPAILLHELAHAGIAQLVGGDPTLVSSTDMRAELSAVGRWGILAIGASGSAANWLLAGVGLLGLRYGRTSAARWSAWLVTAVNGFLPAWYLAASPLIGFGDWMTVIRRFEPQAALRVGATLLGLGLTWVWWRLATSTLTELAVDSASSASAQTPSLEARTRLAWMTGGGLAVLAATLSPLGLGWALPIAAGSTLGTTWPMMPAAREAASRIARSGRSPAPVAASRGVVIAGALAGVLFVVFVGRGIPL